MCFLSLPLQKIEQLEALRQECRSLEQDEPKINTEETIG